MSFFSRKVSSKHLSDRKNRFLKSKAHEPYQLVVEDYAPIIQHYIAKYSLENITVVINGSTDFGQQKISENIQCLQQDIDVLEDTETSYASIIKQYWVPPGSSVPSKFYLNSEDKKNSDFSPYYQELYNAIKDEFLDENDFLKELNPPDLIKLNQICLGLNCQNKLEEYRIEMLEDLERRKNKVCLTKQQALDEINEIQKNLKTDESIIYFFTNNRRIGPAHFEFIQIKHDEIIKPVHWFLENSTIIDETDLKTLFITDVSNFISPAIDSRFLQPQVDKVNCGTLGILYLKELLKNNTQQLTEFSLKLPLYQYQYGEVKSNYLFFPSPHVLRYSQSNFYNEVILAMLKNEHEATIKYKGVKYKIKPLKVILEESIELAKEQNDLSRAKENEQILEDLPAFRKKWLMAYKTEIQKRNAMQGDKYNLYLAYSSKRMEALAHQSTALQEEQTNPAGRETAKKNASLLERVKKTLHIKDVKRTPNPHLFYSDEKITKVVDNPLYEEKESCNPLYEPKY